MNLKDFLTSKGSQPELYWSLVIEKGWVQAGIWFIGDKAAEVVSISSGAAWVSDQELLEATDAVLSSAVQKLPEDFAEPQKTVFGVSTTWVKDGEIAEEFLAKIKKLCTELSLTPVGFVVLPEAIAHLYKSEEGTPLSAIVLKSGDENLEISIFKLGSLVGSTEVARSVSLVEDVTEGLSRFDTTEPPPSRFIVYDGKEGDLEEVKQTLIQATWGDSSKIKFLHTPQVEILETDRKVLATSLAGAAEIGDVSAVIQKDDDVVEEPKPEDSEVIPAKVEPNIVSAENLGFSVGQDVSAGQESVMEKNDIQNVIPVAPVPNVVPVAPPIPRPSPAKVAEEYISKSKNLFHSFSMKLFPRIRNTVPKIKNSTLVTILIVLAVAIIGTILLWWFGQKAKVTIFVTPKRFEEQTQISFNTNGEFDALSGNIPAELVTDQVTGEKVKATSGTKLIGNKAAGNVQIANGNGAPVNLAAGTIITSSSGFKFVTNSSASVSGQLLPGSPGVANIDVTAGDIGAQYNLAKGEIFSVGNYSKALVAGTSTADFSGGSSQQVSAVSREDQTGLESDLKGELTQNTKSNLLAKVSGDSIFVDELAGLAVASEEFDHKVGDSADSLKLSLSLNASGLAADKVKLLEYAVNVLKGKTPEGYSLKEDQIDFKFTFVSLTDGKYNYNVTIGANFLPEVDQQKIIAVIAGKTPVVVQNHFASIPGFDHAEVTLSIKFPGALGTLPRISKNISIDVRAE
jgi:hypothetical protein